MKLSEKLYELRASSESLGGGVFVDMRPVDFRDLLREAAAMARKVEGATVGRRYTRSKDDWLVTPDEDGGVTFPYQRVRIMPIEDQEVTDEG